MNCYDRAILRKVNPNKVSVSREICFRVIFVCTVCICTVNMTESYSILKSHCFIIYRRKFKRESNTKEQKNLKKYTTNSDACVKNGRNHGRMKQIDELERKHKTTEKTSKSGTNCIRDTSGRMLFELMTLSTYGLNMSVNNIMTRESPHQMSVTRTDALL